MDSIPQYGSRRKEQGKRKQTVLTACSCMRRSLVGGCFIFHSITSFTLDSHLAVAFFFLCLASSLGKHVVFGRVESGMAVVKKLGMTPTHADDRPKYDVQIASCGQVGLGGSLEGGGEGVRGVSAVSESGAEGGGGGSGAKEDGHKEGDDGAGGDAKAPGELEEEEEEYDEAAESAANEEAMSEMTDKQKRLFKLRMSINKVGDTFDNDVLL